MDFEGRMGDEEGDEEDPDKDAIYSFQVCTNTTLDSILPPVL